MFVIECLSIKVWTDRELDAEETAAALAQAIGHTATVHRGGVLLHEFYADEKYTWPNGPRVKTE